MRRLTVLAITIVAAALAGGCAPPADQTDFQVQVIDAPPHQALSEAIVVLRREFPQLAANPSRLEVNSAPVEFVSHQSGTASELVHAPARMRRTAHLRVAPQGGGAVVMLRIDVDREDTARRRVFERPASEYRLSDSPSYTPIEREAATTEEQRTLWTPVRRDRAMERSLLNELAEAYAPGEERQPLPPATESSVSPTPPAEEPGVSPQEPPIAP